MSRLAQATAISLCLVAVVCLPSAAGHGPDPVAVYEFTDTGEAQGWSNVTLPEEPSQELLERFDQDDDERIDEAEADQLEAFLHATGEDADPRTAWDGEGPAGYTVEEVEVTNAVGPIADDDRLHLHSASTISYPDDGEDATHVWTRLTDQADDGRHLLVKAPPGHTVSSQQGLEATENDGTWLEGQTTSDEDVVVVFSAEEADRDAIPAASAAAAVAVIAAAALARRDP